MPLHFNRVALEQIDRIIQVRGIDHRWRKLSDHLLELGRTADEIDAFFVAEHGLPIGYGRRLALGEIVSHDLEVESSNDQIALKVG